VSFQVAIQATDRLIIGVGTDPDYTFPQGTDFGADYPIITVEDDAEVAVLNADTNPNWLTRAAPYHVVDAANKV